MRIFLRKLFDFYKFKLASSFKPRCNTNIKSVIKVFGVKIGALVRSLNIWHGKRMLPLPNQNDDSVSEKLKVILSENERQFVDIYCSLNKHGREWVTQSMIAAEAALKRNL